MFLNAPVTPATPAFPPTPSAKRANTLSIKSRLADLFDSQQGAIYWKLLQDFLTGAINRDEFDQGWQEHLSGVPKEAASLHNALLLSVLYNVCKPAPTPSTRHTGWTKRQRDEDGAKLDDRDPKKRRIKKIVMALGKKERSAIKDMSRQQVPPKILDTFDGPFRLLANESLAIHNAIASKPKIGTFQQDFNRCAQAPLCTESGELPDLANARDRLSLVAYRHGIYGGATESSAALLKFAVEDHLKMILHALLEHAPGKQPAQADSKSVKGDTKKGIMRQTKSNFPTSENPSYVPRCIDDTAALFEVAPQLVARGLVGAIENMYALHPAGKAGDSCSTMEVNHCAASDADDEKDGQSVSVSRASSLKRKKKKKRDDQPMQIDRISPTPTPTEAQGPPQPPAISIEDQLFPEFASNEPNTPIKAEASPEKRLASPALSIVTTTDHSTTESDEHADDAIHLAPPPSTRKKSLLGPSRLRKAESTPSLPDSPEKADSETSRQSSKEKRPVDAEIARRRLFHVIGGVLNP